jgi:hypothetical protein
MWTPRAVGNRTYGCAFAAQQEYFFAAQLLCLMTLPAVIVRTVVVGTPACASMRTVQVLQVLNAW